MANFQNNPSLTGSEASIRKIVHQPLTVEHFGLHAKIQENGSVVISGVPTAPDEHGESEWDEVTIQSQLVFELASVLKASRTVEKNGDIRRYTHQPLTLDRFGVTAAIQSNGKITLTQYSKDENGEAVKDEVEISASLIFKLITLLKASRTIKYSTVSEEREG